MSKIEMGVGVLLVHTVPSHCVITGQKNHGNTQGSLL